MGSFLNVCIYRIPRKEDIVLERSHCMSCGNVLKWYELIPVISFLIQGGKCRSCKTKLSLQYPIIELANGLIYIWIFAVKGFGLESVLFCACASTLIVISMIDWIIKVLEGLPNLLRGFREGFTIKTSIVVEGSS